MIEKITLERSEEISEFVKQILIPTQIMMQIIPIEEMEEMLEKLKDSTSISRALPFPVSQNKADINEKKNDLYAAIINLMKKQKIVLGHKDDFIDEKAMKELGMF